MNAFDKIAKHHAENVYKKGAHAGDAPAGARGMTHFRVIKHTHCYTVRMHKTDIMVVTPDGNVSIDCDGWAERPTTKLRLNDALGKFVSGVYLMSTQYKSHRQLALRIYADGNGLYRYYDGIVLDTNTTRHPRVISELKTFQGRRVDAARVASLMQDVEDSGFKDAFKVLHAVTDQQNADTRMPYVGIESVITDNQYAEFWPTVVARFATHRYWSFPLQRYVTEVRDAKDTWQRLMREVKKSMFETYDTGMTKVQL